MPVRLYKTAASELARNLRNFNLLEMMEEMSQAGVAIDAPFYNVAVDICKKRGDIESLQQVLKRMKEDKITPDGSLLWELAQLFGKYGDLEQLKYLLSSVPENRRNFAYDVARIRGYSIISKKTTNTETLGVYKAKADVLFYQLMQKIDTASESAIAHIMTSLPEHADEVYERMTKPVGSIVTTAYIRALCDLNDEDAYQRAKKLFYDEQQKSYIPHVALFGRMITK